MSYNNARTTDKYIKIKREGDKAPENEIRIRADPKIGRYIAYAATLLLEKKLDTVIIKASGVATKSACQVAEILRHRILGLHQVIQLKTISVVDEYEPQEEGLDRVKVERQLAVLEITLSLKDSGLDTKAPGYQVPLPKDQVQEEELKDLVQGRRPGGRGGRREDGRGETRGEDRGEFGGEDREGGYRGGRGGYRGGRGGYRGGNREGGYRGGRGGYRGGNREGGYREGGHREGGYREGGNREGGYREGGNREGGYREGGHREGGYREGGNREGGYREGGNREGGNREGGNREGGYREGGNRDGGRPRRGGQ